MAILPKINRIQLMLDIGEVLQEKRPYIGYSSLGHKCQRYVWLNFRWAFDRYVDKRLARIFERGDLEEPRVVRDLISSGISVLNTQQELVDETGHIRGHIDGLVRNVPGYVDEELLLEIKTMNHKRFTTFKNIGLKQSDPEYYVQINMYMGSLALNNCLFIVTDKDTEERNYSIISFDENTYLEYSNIAKDILTADDAPNKIGPSTYYACKICSAYGLCHRNEAPVKSCRSCKHVNIEMDGVWSCGLDNELLSLEAQRLGCDDYESIDI